MPRSLREASGAPFPVITSTNFAPLAWERCKSLRRAPYASACVMPWRSIRASIAALPRASFCFSFRKNGLSAGTPAGRWGETAACGSTVALSVTRRFACRTPALCRASVADFLLSRSGRTVRATSDHKCSSSAVSGRRPNGASNFGTGVPLFIGATDGTHAHARTEPESVPISSPNARGLSSRLRDGAAHWPVGRASREVTAYGYRPRPDRDRAAAGAQTDQADGHDRRSDLPHRQLRNRDRRGPARRWRNRC